MGVSLLRNFICYCVKFKKLMVYVSCRFKEVTLICHLSPLIIGLVICHCSSCRLSMTRNAQVPLSILDIRTSSIQHQHTRRTLVSHYGHFHNNLKHSVANLSNTRLTHASGFPSTSFFVCNHASIVFNNFYKQLY